MQQLFKLPLKYLLRWRFDFADRPSVAGMWLNPGNGIDNSAKNTSKKGLVRAVIEAKEYETSKLAEVAGCMADEYDEFKWLGMTSLRQGKLPVHGLQLITKKKKILVTIDGKISTEQRV